MLFTSCESQLSDWQQFAAKPATCSGWNWNTRHAGANWAQWNSASSLDAITLVKSADLIRNLQVSDQRRSFSIGQVSHTVWPIPAASYGHRRISKMITKWDVQVLLVRRVRAICLGAKLCMEPNLQALIPVTGIRLSEWPERHFASAFPMDFNEMISLTKIGCPQFARATNRSMWTSHDGPWRWTRFLRADSRMVVGSLGFLLLECFWILRVLDAFEFQDAVRAAKGGSGG